MISEGSCDTENGCVLFKSVSVYCPLRETYLAAR